MSISGSDFSQPLAEVVNYLFTRRESLLNSWRTICENESGTGKVSQLSREEFNNQIPTILDILELRLLSKPQQVILDVAAQAHGLHRWQKTYSLIETMGELNVLTQTLFNGLKLYTELYPDTDKALLVFVYDQINLVMQQTIHGSVQKYDELQRLQASSRAATLQQAVDQMQELSLERSEMLRTSSHDLRGSFGIISSAAMMLKMEDFTLDERRQFLDMMVRSLKNVHGMLTGLMDLSRLEAGQESLLIESLDAAELLKDIVSSAQSMAAEKNIILRTDGANTLLVETDRIKLYRIIQNILINALKYTPSNALHPAIVSVSWSSEGDYRWAFSIQDSGPGIPDTLSGIFTNQLRPTVEATAVMEPGQAEPVVVLPNGMPQIPSSDQLAELTNHATKSEGVGLQIVKRLCKLLDANLDIESVKGRGTLVRVRLPIHHSGI
jgi:signal transduction histidine kinase